MNQILLDSKRLFRSCAMLLVAHICLCAPFGASCHSNGTSARGHGLRFTHNKGQWNENIRYKARIPLGHLYFENDGFKSLRISPEDYGNFHPKMTGGKKEVWRAHVVKTVFENGNPNPQIIAEAPFQMKENFFYGSDTANWKSNVRSFAKLTYQNVYPGVDVVFREDHGDLKYDFILQPGANPEHIRLRYEGAEKLFIDHGLLNIVTSFDTLMETIPLAYQVNGSAQESIQCRYMLLNDSTIGFTLPDGYDPNRELVIDPALIFSTYTGSFADNWGMTATYDEDGALYSGGVVGSDGLYPTTVGAFQVVYGGEAINFGSFSLRFDCDMAIVKYSPDGTQRLYSTYLGGNNNEQATSLVVNSAKELFVLGQTRSSNFPTPLAAQSRTLAGVFAPDANTGDIDIVVAKLNLDGTALVGGTYMGGSDLDGINSIFNPLYYFYADDTRGEIVLDSQEQPIIITSSLSFNFPVTPGTYQPNRSGVQDAVLFKLESDARNIVWSTYFGGSGIDAGYAMAVAPNDDIYFTGGTQSFDLPASPNAFQNAYNGGQADGYVFRLSANGRSIVSGTYVGTSDYDQTFFVDLDKSNNVYFVGQTEGAYPTLNANYNEPDGKQFITKLPSSLGAPVYSFRFGSGSTFKTRPDITFTAFLVDICENIYVSGWGSNGLGLAPLQQNISSGSSWGMETTPNAFAQQTDSSDFYMMVVERDAQSLLYGSYFGDPNADDHVDGGTSRFDEQGVIYHSVCASCGGSNTFPTTPGVVSQNNNSVNCNNASFKFSFDLQDPVIADFEGPFRVCAGAEVAFTNTSTGSSDFIWNFGDGSPETSVENPTHSFSPGLYEISLIAVNPTKCNISDTVRKFVFVDEVFPADFTFDNPACSREINAEYTGGADFLWEFGDGATNGSSANPTHEYPDADSSYTLTLVTDPDGECPDTASQNIIITTPPEADFSINAAACDPVREFQNRSSSDAALLTWFFPDSTISGRETLSFEFDQNGQFDVALVAEKANGCRDTAARTLGVQLNFSIGGQVQPDRSICRGQTSGLLELTDFRGTVIGWQASRDGGLTWRDQGKAGFTEFVSGRLTVSTRFRAVVQADTCPADTSDPAIIDVTRSVGGNLLFGGDVETCAENYAPELRLADVMGSIVEWQFSEDEGQTWDSINSTDSSLAPSAITRSTWYRVRIDNGLCGELFSNTARFNLRPPSIGGSLPPDGTVCFGETSPALELENFRGEILGWEASRDFGATWRSQGKAGLSEYRSGRMTIGAWFRAIVKTDGCPPAFSDTSKISVVPFSAPGVLTGAKSHCGPLRGHVLHILNERGDVLFWESKAPDAAEWEEIAYTGVSFTLPTVNESRLYRAKIGVAGESCNGGYTDEVLIEIKPHPVAGKLTGSGAVCRGEPSGLMRLTGFEGDILRWETSKVTTANWRDVGKAGLDAIVSGRLTVDSWFRVVVGIEGCGVAVSNPVRWSVEKAPDAPPGRIEGKNAICRGGQPPVLRAADYIGTLQYWEYKKASSSSWVRIPTANKELLFRDLDETTDFRYFSLNGGVCNRLYMSEIFRVEVGESKVELDVQTAGTCGDVGALLAEATGGIDNDFRYYLQPSTKPPNADGRFVDLPYGEYLVYAEDGAGCAADTMVQLTRGATAPAIVSITEITPRSAVVRWTESPDASLKYALDYRLAGASEWQTVASGLSSSFYLLGGLSAGASYEVRVTGVCEENGIGIQIPQGPEAVAQFETPYLALCEREPPDYPPGLRLDFIDAVQARASWRPVQDMNAGRQGYIIAYGLRNVSPRVWPQFVVCHPDTNYLLTGLTPGTEYGVRVRSNCTNCTTALKNTDRRSHWNGPVFFKTPDFRTDVSSKESGKAGFSIYPNPSDGAFELRFAGNDAQTIRLSIFKNNGALLKEETFQLKKDGSKRFLFSGVSGVFIARIETERAVFYEKLIILP